MDKQNLIIFKSDFLYEIFKELEQNINLTIYFAKNEKILNEKINNLESYIIITKKKITGYNNQFLIEKLPFKVVKDFRIGSNCFIDNYDIIEEIKEYINVNNITDHVFLFSAASLSNLLAHQLYEMNNKNTYIDVGSTLNPIMDMTGWTGTRTYLNQYWNSTSDKSQLEIIDIWT